MSRNLKLLIALAVVLTAAAWVVFVMIPSEVARRGYEGARTLSEDLRKAFNFTPEIQVNNTVVIQQQSPAFELAVVTQNFEHRYHWRNVWLGSTKRITITGGFTAKVGFDLDKRFSISLRDNKAFVMLAPPEILSVESRGDIVYRDEQGIWNWVDNNDRNRATNAFITDARRYAERAGFIDDARREMERRLREVLAPHVDEVVVEYETRIPPSEK